MEYAHEQEVDETRPLAPTGAAPIPHFGWTRVAMALRPLSQDDDSILRVDIAGHGPLLIDVATDAFWWESPLSELPVDADDIHIEPQSRSLDVATIDAPGRDLSELLWDIGLRSFPGELAWWLKRTGRYRLSRWPNFTTLEHTPDHVRMTSLLGYAFLTPDELAEQANVAPADARQLINAFSLMRILRSESPELTLARPVLRRAETTPLPVPDAAAARPTGLFRRLRERFGL